MTFFNRDKNKRCLHCGKKNDIYYKDQNHAFFCEHCHYPLYWDAIDQRIEADTDRSEKAHKSWAKKRKQQAAGGSSCLVSLLNVILLAAPIREYMSGSDNLSFQLSPRGKNQYRAGIAHFFYTTHPEPAGGDGCHLMKEDEYGAFSRSCRR